MIGDACSGTGPARILVVADAISPRTSIVRALRRRGFTVRGRGHGDGLEEVLDDFRPDLVVLDAVLPGRDGFAPVDVVRARGDAGVVVVADHDDLDDRLRRPGVDVHVVTPVRRAELVSGVHAALRRRGRLGAALRVGDLVIDDSAGTATRNGASLALTATELRLLRCLADRRGWTVSKDQLLQQVWGYGRYAPNLVEVHLCALRRKLEVHGPRIVHTRRGLGYVLRPAGETVP